MLSIRNARRYLRTYEYNYWMHRRSYLLLPKSERFTVPWIKKDTAWMFVEPAIGFYGANLSSVCEVGLQDSSPFGLPLRVVSIAI